MDHDDHVYLLRKGVPAPGGVWADLGSGTGAFTLALAEVAGPTAEIYAIDQDERALRQQQRAIAARFPDVTVHYQVADFTRPLTLPPLDGLLMANALHFVRRKDNLVTGLKSYLRPGGRFLLVEYNTDRGNPWVPHPLSYESWATLARRSGFSHTELLATVPSRFLGQIYAAASW
ncbi:MAG: class I SAM-dependent methyltransferase [Chloroflexi bacterium]|nr:class I SAM-dependent methyltransferase [Chloroflexota bacterium]MCI0576956.1 class I SAM-dependent methyltransferase [Chloroflexota bacterium]MCI0645554.1 class I SAM-dependent methyltransferase [Chloroflexota bacterium]MCI0730949.1 class I SAM-dependent methyltransferase [Chloroflexota bacterium]